jgi:uncharacterized membrane protein YbhN (UPF0104 family)
VLELAFINGLEDMDEADVLAALIVFHLLYLIVPFVLSLFMILIFEWQQFGRDDA